MSYSVTTTIQPLKEPVLIADVKLQARIDLAAEDDLITSNIITARMLLEDHLSRSFITQTNRLIIDQFPSSGNMNRVIQLPRHPLQSIDSVNYIDEDGNAQVVATSVYGTDLIGQPGSVFLLDGQSWPDDVRWQPNAVYIDFVAGYGLEGSDVPEPIKYWLKACGALADDLREIDVFSLMPVSQLGGYRVVIKQEFKPWTS